MMINRKHEQIEQRGSVMHSRGKTSISGYARCCFIAVVGLLGSGLPILDAISQESQGVDAQGPVIFPLSLSSHYSESSPSQRKNTPRAACPSGSGPDGVTFSQGSYTRHEQEIQAIITYTPPANASYSINCQFLRADTTIKQSETFSCSGTAGNTFQQTCTLPILNAPGATPAIRRQLGTWFARAYIDGVLLDNQGIFITTDYPAIDPHPEYNMEAFFVKKQPSDSTDTTLFYASQVASVPNVYLETRLDYYHHVTGMTFYSYYEYPTGSGV